MTYTALELINRAYNLSRVVSRGLQSVNGVQQETGLFLLNAILVTKGTNTRLIPYFSKYNGTFIAGTPDYFIQNLYGVETMVFFIDTIRYPMSDASRKEFYGSARAENVDSLPYQYRVEREEGGANISVYYVPIANYPFQIWGKFGLTNVSINQDLSLTYDGFYIEYLRYALAEYICDDSGVSFNPQSAARLKQIEHMLMDVSPPDMRIYKSSTLSGTPIFNYAQANIGKGWTAPLAGTAIHTDFKDKFVRAEVIEWNKLLEAGSYGAAREKGWVRTEGKEYIVQDGDVIEFKI